MFDRPYELIQTPRGMVMRIRARGGAVLSTPMINRGTAFTVEERRALGLTGLLPNGVSTLEGQLLRVYAQYRAQASDLARNVYLATLRDRNAVLFYRLLCEHIEEMLPVVYTPPSGRPSSALAMSSAARTGCTCRWTTPMTWRGHSATPG